MIFYNLIIILNKKFVYGYFEFLMEEFQKEDKFWKELYEDIQADSYINELKSGWNGTEIDCT